jgi:WD40 repeat protein
MVASADRRTLATLDGWGRVSVFDDAGRPVPAFAGFRPGAGLAWPVLAMRPDGKELATASDAQTLVLRPIPEGPARTFRHPGTIQAAAYSPTGGQLAAVSQAGRLRVWDAATGAEVWSADEPAGQVVRWLAYDPRGGVLLTSGGDGAARLRDGASGEVLRTLEGKVMLGAFSPDGARIASASDPESGQVQIHDAQTGRLLLRLREPRHRIYGVAFSPDGRRLVVSGYDRKETSLKVHLLDAGPKEEP